MAKAIHCPSCGGGLEPQERACPRCGSTVATRRCAVCLDLNLAGDRNCRRCGRLLPQEKPGARADRLLCPGCGAAMTPRSIGNSVFDECDACGGLWLSPDAAVAVTVEAEARALLRPFDAPAPEGSEPAPSESLAYRRCPACCKHMNRVSSGAGSGVVVDACKQHGTYFDRGELSHLFTYIERGGLQKARRREAEALRAEVRDARRKAIAMGGGEVALGVEARSPFSSPGLDLLRWIAGLLRSDL